MNTKEQKKESTFRLSIPKKARHIEPENIIRLEAQENYTYIYTNTGKFIFAKTLKYFESSLDSEKFIRAHKSHIVNKTHVKSVSFSGHRRTLKLKSGVEISVSRRRKKEVQDLLRI